MREWIRREKPVFIVMTLLVAQWLAFVGKYAAEVAGGTAFGGDFVVFWRAAQLLPGGDWAAIYAPAQAASGEVMPFVYPPPMLLLLGFFSDVHYAVSAALWLGVTGFAWVLAVLAWGRRLNLPLRGRTWLLALAAVLSPFAMMNLLAGQTGFLVGALALWGMYHLPRRPLLAGALLGLLGLKPQMLLLMPFLLLFTRQRRALAGMLLSLAGMSLLATLLYGAGVWGVYFEALKIFPPLIAQVMPQLQEMLVSFGPFMQAHGAADGLVRLLQALALAFSLALLWRLASPQAQVRFQCWYRTLPLSPLGRRHKPMRAADEGSAMVQAPFALNWPKLCALTCVLAFLAAPYAMAYDFPLLMLPALWLLAHSQARPLSPGKRLALLLLLLLPMLGASLQEYGFPLYWPLLALAAWGMLSPRRPS